MFIAWEQALTTSPCARPLLSCHSEVLNVPSKRNTCDANAEEKVFSFGTRTAPTLGAGHGGGEMEILCWISRINESWVAQEVLIFWGGVVRLQPLDTTISCAITVPAWSIRPDRLLITRLSQVPFTLSGRLEESVPEIFNLHTSERESVLVPSNPPAR